MIINLSHKDERINVIENEWIIKNGQSREAIFGTPDRRKPQKANMSTTQTTETMMSNMDSTRTPGSGHGCFGRVRSLCFL